MWSDSTAFSAHARGIHVRELGYKDVSRKLLGLQSSRAFVSPICCKMRRAVPDCSMKYFVYVFDSMF